MYGDVIIFSFCKILLTIIFLIKFYYKYCCHYNNFNYLYIIIIIIINIIK